MGNVSAADFQLQSLSQKDFQHVIIIYFLFSISAAVWHVLNETCTFKISIEY